MPVPQAERRARSRSALLESAARGLSRYGYGNLVLEQVAREAGYTRGALYHQFRDKEELALAVIEWVNENWIREVGSSKSSNASARSFATSFGEVPDAGGKRTSASPDAAGTGLPFADL